MDVEFGIWVLPGVMEVIDEMQNLASQKTRNYAKRQLTWFRHQFDDIIFCENEEEIFKYLKNNNFFENEI